MASLSGPADFLVNLLVLLLLMVVVVLATDRLLKNRSGARQRKPRERKKKKKAVQGASAAVEDHTNTARLTRNYFTNGGRKALTPQEREFGALYEEANKALNDDPRGSLALALMKKMDNQYIRMLSFFEDAKDRGSGLHMEHNYLWLKYRQRAEDDPNGAFMVLAQSLGKLMERQGVQPYAVKEFSQMMERYEGTTSHLHQARGFNINSATVGFFSFSARLNLMLKEHPDPAAQEAVGKIVIEFVRIMLERHYLKMVQSHFLLELRVEHIQAITDQVEGLRRVQENTGRPDPEVHMICHYLVCRLRMAQLRIMATLEPSPGRAQDMHEAHLRKLANDAALSGGESRRWAALRGEGGNRSMLAQTELVALLAAHFQSTYAKRHVLESWTTMEAVKRKVVEEVVEKKVPVAEELLSCCDEEWKVLSSSTREWFSRRAPIKQEDGINLPTHNDGGLGSLRIMSHVQEKGISPETLIRMLEALKRENPSRRTWPSDHRNMMKALTGRGGLRRLDLAGPNYEGVLIGPHFAFLIKATNDRIDAGTITVAVETCQSAGAREVLICVNFSSELVTAETLRRFFTIIEKKSPETTFSAADMEQLTSALATCLRDNGVNESFELAPNLAI